MSDSQIALLCQFDFVSQAMMDMGTPFEIVQAIQEIEHGLAKGDVSTEVATVMWKAVGFSLDEHHQLQDEYLDHKHKRWP